MKLIKSILFIFLLQNSLVSFSQNIDSALQTANQIPAKYYSKVDKKIKSVDGQLTKKSLKYLAKFQKQELKFEQKSKDINPQFVITNANTEYAAIEEKIKNKTKGVTKIIGGEYNASLDSLGTSLAFLNQFRSLKGKVQNPLNNFDKLQSNFQESEKIEAFIAQRKNEMGSMLSKYAQVSNVLKNQYAKLSQTASYYSLQIKEYKDMFKDPGKSAQKVLNILNKLPAFQKFWSKNSYWTKLFPIPDNAGTPQALYGLQTRDQLKKDLQQKFGVSNISLSDKGGGGGGYFQQQMQQTQQQLSDIKNKLSQFGGTSSLTMPESQPNTQHTKTFLKRIQYGVSVQNASGDNVLPAISTISLNLGYRVSDKATLGIGGNYLLGWGHGFNHISLSSQGVGVKSFVDIKAKGNIWISGGMEYNYMEQFTRLVNIKNLNLWQKSALIGLTKKFKIGKKEHDIQLLYDFLANQEIPAGQFFKFRMGWEF